MDTEIRIPVHFILYKWQTSDIASATLVRGEVYSENFGISLLCSIAYTGRTSCTWSTHLFALPKINEAEEETKRWFKCIELVFDLFFFLANFEGAFVINLVSVNFVRGHTILFV